METDKTKITVETLIQSPIENIWKMWNTPEDIVHWYFASDDWQYPAASNDLQIGH